MQLKVEGATLHYEVDGRHECPAVLLWHGAHCTLRMWDHVVSRLQDDFQLIRFDVRGVGKSTPAADPEKQYTFEQYSRDANDLLDACAVARCHVWAMAWGSRAALAYCSLFPERVLSASLFDASIGAADVKAQREGAKVALGKQVASGMRRFEYPAGWNVHDTPEMVPLAMAAAAKFNLKAAVPRLTMPLLVATGDHDPNLASSRELVAAAPAAQLEVFTSVGHGSVLQRPDLAVAAFQNFQSALR